MPAYQRHSLDAQPSIDDTHFDPSMHRLEPAGSAYSSHSISRKNTGATLAESFSSGGVRHDMVSHSREDSIEAPGDFFPGTMGDMEYNDSVSGYTEFQKRTQDQDDTDTLEYTAAGPDEDEYYSNHNHSVSAAMHARDIPYNEDTSVGTGMETCSKTLNTNLEGINFIPDSEPAEDHQQPYPPQRMAPMPSEYSAHTRTVQHLRNPPPELQSEYFYEENAGHQDEYAEEGYYYENEGGFVGSGEQFYDTAAHPNGGHPTLELDGHNTVGSGLTKEAAYQDDQSAPIESYDSEDSGSSWDDEETRDASLLDSKSEGDEEGTFDDEDVSEDGSEEDSDDSGESDDSEDEDDHKGRSRRSGGRSVLDLLKGMKNCSLKGATSISYDSGDFEFLPDVAQISSAVTSMTSMTDSFATGRSRESSMSRKKGSQQKRKGGRRKKDDNLDNLFGKVSALGEELMGPEGKKKKNRKRSSSRRQRERDPATKIVDSLRDIFSCGNPRYY